VVGVAAIAALLWYGARRPQEPVVRLVAVYAFSALQGVLDEAVLPAFAASWQERTGEKVEFVTTFAGSGLIVERIVSEVPADVAILASDLDVVRLRRRGAYFGDSGGEIPHGGVPFRSPIVLAVRAGNPSGVADLDDLRVSEASILHADPLTSGAGEWSLLACFGAARVETGDAGEAARRLEETWRRVGSTFPSARRAALAFEEGKGDVLVTYEAEALRLRETGAGVEIVYPAVTVSCEPVVVKLAKNVGAEDAELVDELIRFLWSGEAQAIFAEHGFRPVEPTATASGFPEIGRLLTLADFGGAEAAERDVVLGVWKNRILAPSGRSDVQ
jgi:sulfate transport system substrate-binding protein